ncbi:helix-turn-helix domain-containing protein [Candidatus Manganitrophus noduliformans]|uniref:Sigma-54 factor interaction domain-containing protein n=1 Tax=Candidatus Manganitrophus noduliformans TaxID=2606439 RepID=A0A7X6IE88_9BACT|nr:helix-turn-helix domain-containing protein [Candidatus Manganitrophus noduliformans]NKE73824.1 hypothetical protein [Candidatus Manganitrophus noduliformans]
MRFSPEAEKVLLNYSWPGNVRELRNMIEQTVLLSRDSVIAPEQLSLLTGLIKMNQVDRQKENMDRFPLPLQGISLEKVERDFVLQALEQTSWNVTQAAKLLGLTRDTLRYRMDKYKLEPSSSQ